jgi:5'-3' exonuclease
MTKQLTALIDADILIYQAAAAAETPVNWGAGIWTLHAFEQDAVRLLSDHYEKIMEKTYATQAIMCISCPSSEGWRKQVLPTYKENRADVRPPMLREFLKEHVRENYTTFERPTLEGDDILGILATKGKKHPDEEVIVCSLDKDLKTIPGRHYNFGKDSFLEITEDQADYWHLMQALTGDTTDGYKGCPGVGEVTAEKLLHGITPEDRWAVVCKAYEKKGLGEEEALVQARVARICRASDYDFNKKEVKLWNPPQH